MNLLFHYGPTFPLIYNTEKNSFSRLELTQHDLQNLQRNLEKNNRPSFQILVVNNLAHFAT